eukprot:scaffold3280_cov177-Skeletonema_marinoi.AAC.1
MDDNSDLSEALALKPFTSLPSTSSGVSTDDAKRADGTGRSILCCCDNNNQNNKRAAVPGIVFRAVADNNGVAVEAVQLVSPSGLTSEEEDAENKYNIEGGEMIIIGSFSLSDADENSASLVSRMAISDDQRLLLIGLSDGTIKCINVLYQTSDNQTSIQFTKRWRTSNINKHSNVQFPTLEFVHDNDRQHQFIVVTEELSTPSPSRCITLMDATSDDLTNVLPPNEIMDSIINSDDMYITCATTATNHQSDDGTLTLLFGTNVGKLGLATISSTSETAEVQFIHHPLLDEVDDDGVWKITHLNWFDSQSIAMGLTRVIVDPDSQDDEDDEDDPNEHQANFLIGTQLDPSSWEWTELGDVVPFFSVPKGGRHVFHTSTLSCNTSTLLLVGCNVGSDVAILAKQNGAWDIIDVEEGNQMSCPTDEDDEFLFLMGLGVVMLPMPGMQRWHPFPTLASTDGSLTGFVPCHEILGEQFFSRVLDGVAAEADMSIALPVMSVALPVASSPVAPATEAAEACILSGLDLHLDDDESSIDSLDSYNSDEESEPDDVPSTQPVFGTGSAPSFNFATPSFSFAGGSSDANTTTTPSNAFGSAPTAGGFAFGSTATSFGFGSPSALGASAAASTPAKEQPASKPVFGAGSAAPVFGSSTTFTGGFGMLATSTDKSKGFGAAQTETAPKSEEPTKPTAAAFGSGAAIPKFGSQKAIPFGAFGTACATFSATTMAPGMVKPLFGETKKEEQPSTEKRAESSEAADKRRSESSETTHVEEADTLTASGPGKKAAQAFDSVLADADGCKTTLPSSQFEALVDEVGEGFHGDEMDKQLAAIDKDDQGDITRNAFVRWYCSLVDQDDDDDGSSQESEIAEEKEKAEEAFDALANDSEHISVTEFPKLLESLGSTYCEEEHRRTIKKISSVDDASSDKVITRKAFIGWYIEWLFGDGDSEEESDDESTAGADVADSSDAAAQESTGGAAE